MKFETVSQLAKKLGRGEKFIRAEIRSGRLRAIDLRGIVIDPRDIKKWLASREVALAQSQSHDEDEDDFAPFDPHVCSVNGQRYVVVASINGVLAVYRLGRDGRLLRQKRMPKGS